MKKGILILFVILSFHSFSQNMEYKKVPSAVINRFNTLYSTVTDNEWGKVNLDNYETEFEYKGVKTSVLFDTKGNVLQTYEIMKPTDIPSPINDYIEKNYFWKKIMLATKVIDGHGKMTYRITLGVDDIKLIFDYQGNFVRLSK
jgi:hypothetical protein